MGQKQSIDDYGTMDRQSVAVSQSGSQWSAGSYGPNQNAIPIGVAPAISTAEFPFVPYLSRKDCIRILEDAPVGAYVLFTDPSGRGNIAVRMPDRLLRLKLRKSAEGVAIHMPGSPPQPPFRRLVDLLLYYAVERDDIAVRLALPCFDFSTLREEDEATLERSSMARNMRTIDEGETAEFGADNNDNNPSMVLSIPDQRETPATATALASAGDVVRHLDTRTATSARPTPKGPAGATMQLADKHKPNFFDTYSWWRASDPGAGADNVDPWCHGPFWSYDLAVGVLRSYGSVNGAYLIRQLVLHQDLQQGRPLPTPSHEILVLSEGNVLNLPLRWEGDCYRLGFGANVPTKLQALDVDVRFNSLHHVYEVLSQYASEHFQPLSRAVIVPAVFQGDGSSLPRWYFAALSKAQAEAVLATCPPNTFLVRKAASGEGVYYLSLCTADKFVHLCVQEHDDLSWSVGGVTVQGAVSLSSTIEVLAVAEGFFPYALDRYVPCLPPFKAMPAPTTSTTAAALPPPQPMQSQLATDPAPLPAVNVTASPHSEASSAPSSEPDESRRSSTGSETGLSAGTRRTSTNRMDEAALRNPDFHVSLVLKRRKQESWGVMLRTVHGQQGTVVGGVDSGGPADCSGLKFGDVFVAAGSKDLLAFSHAEIRNLLRGKKSVSVTVARTSSASRAPSQFGGMSHSSSNVFR
eukprot:TRINITY_DN4427_c0_g1_i1.p1 TRINITY_DN4427_c0_g1~~TRINITY_DN4427_c0_g1_i1.p1  ORF type:complete len:692 (+),score=145.44 TRINITY_DN4427_c0_g1_i1:222-2297(+)